MSLSVTEYEEEEKKKNSIARVKSLLTYKSDPLIFATIVITNP